MRALGHFLQASGAPGTDFLPSRFCCNGKGKGCSGTRFTKAKELRLALTNSFSMKVHSS
jgi:hypothetical protein